MADPSIPGSGTASSALSGLSRAAVAALDGEGRRGGVAQTEGFTRGPGDDQPPIVFRFQGQTLDPMAPRGTYLDITV